MSKRNFALEFVKIQSIKRAGYEDVYCLAAEKNSNMIANGIVVSNCDALRYLCATAFKTGQFNHPDENISIEQLRRQVYGNPEELNWGQL